MIDCKRESILILLEEDYDDFIFILLVGLASIYYLEKNIVKTIFKAFIIGSVYISIDMSCYHIGYFNALALSLLAGIYLEKAYRIIRYYLIKHAINKKKQIKEILEIEDIEEDDDIKDKTNKTKRKIH